MNPVFLSLGEIMAIHQDQIERYGGSPELRDIGLLESAVSMPQASFGGQYLHSDLLEMAAAYLYHIVQNHPFIDGNKRTGAVAALVFLDINGIDFDAGENDFEAMVMGCASGEVSKEEVACFIKANSIS